ncbi:MAG: hypothetical protein IKB93_15175 [Clostridia bacterium]|nr:hypothetical protein [Clostridia bacterium]
MNNIIKSKQFRVLYIIVAILLVIVIYSALDNLSTQVPDEPQILEIDESVKINRLSIFKNELPELQNTNVPSVEVKLFEKSCVVNDKQYTIHPTTYTNTDSKIYWNVDLSLLSLCGKSENILLYSYDGKENNDVLVLDKNGELFLLSFGDVLSPFKYSLYDFNVIDNTDNLSDANIKKLWETHLQGVYSITTLCINDKPEGIRLQLKSQMGLSYYIGYSFYKGNYYTRFPYEVNGSQSGSTELK